jgi:hypothetical protein
MTAMPREHQSGESVMRTKPFSLRRMMLCSLPLLALALWVLALSNLASAGSTATASSPARISVRIPASAKDANVVMLEVAISVARRPSSGQLGAVVRFRGTEVGRVSIVADGESYQFRVPGTLSGGSGDVEVSLIDRDGGAAPSGAALSIGHAEIVTR